MRALCLLINCHSAEYSYLIISASLIAPKTSLGAEITTDLISSTGLLEGFESHILQQTTRCIFLLNVCLNTKTQVDNKSLIKSTGLLMIICVTKNKNCGKLHS